MKRKNLYLVICILLFPVLSFCQKKSGQFHSVDTLNVVEGIYWVTDSNAYFHYDTLLSVFVSEKFFDYSWNLLVSKETEFLSGDPEMVKYTKFFSNGNIKERYTAYAGNGRKIGIYLLCHENGNLKAVGRYKTKIPVADAVKVNEIITIEFWEIPEERGTIIGRFLYKEEKVGKWRYFDENGYLIKEENYPEE